MNVSCNNPLVKRIIIIKIMKNIHALVSYGVAALIRGDRGIARLGGHFEPLPLQDQIRMLKTNLGCFCVGCLEALIFSPFVP